MKIYLAAAAPGNETKEKTLPIPKRLLSYWHIIDEQVGADKVFDAIKRGDYGNIFCFSGGTQSKIIRK